MIELHNVEEKIKISEFIKKIKEYGIENIEATKHTLFRLNQKQRKIYSEEKLKRILFDDKPIEIDVQKNGNYAVIYNFNDGKNLLKILISFFAKKIYIVTFYILDKGQERIFKK